jgi:hypothetical protein
VGLRYFRDLLGQGFRTGIRLGPLLNIKEKKTQEGFQIIEKKKFKNSPGFK